MLPRPTVRGWALAGCGAALVVLGGLLGSLDLVRIGLAAVVLVVGAGAFVAWRSPARNRHRIDVRRSVTPNPLHVGETAQVAIHVQAGDAAARARLAGLRFAEQASSELSGGRALRARVERTPSTVEVRYTVRAARRGRWTLGPLVVTRGDLFGVVRAPANVGSVAEVAVWPAIVALPAPSEALVGEPDRVALGARSPSTDDASLRDYREGDDLRRVHWRSSARRGSLLVRSDERAGMRPVTVLLDQPARPAAVEWSISLAASLAVAMLEAGHPVRLLGAGLGESGEVPAFLHAKSGPMARAALLDPLIDLVGPRTEPEAEQRLAAAVRMIQTSGKGDDIVLAVLGPLTPGARTELARISDSAQGWALVRADSRQPGEAAATENTLRALRRAGWHAARVSTGEPVIDCWMRLLGGAP
ncbi:MAG: hypothetical protein BGO37_12240 [Cellulomonas sp. 73-92]|uniref:DUF58 domain-containing protein n=1 Tax=Cellulomonas sp. 73-92 TaxID=1895740 RepID=UPI00092A0DD9|nr:DUF58 domain-containing protein [Cellulomonas sp. 73-92]OJV79708.1 MAG: hypothetical protein BGO37_12240 [Cellulomonas sp. 73-92]